MIAAYLESIVSVITSDGRHLVGTLKGCDQVTNIVLEDCTERIYGETGVESVPLGLFIVRGDNVAIIGDLDTDADDKTDFSLVRGQALPSVIH